MRVYIATPKDEDVGCSSVFDDAVISHYASRLDPMPSARDLALAAMQAIAQRFPSIQNFEGTAANAEADNIPDRVRGRFLIDINGVKHFTKVTVANYGDWSFKQRMTIPNENMMQGDLISELAFIILLLDVTSEADADQAPAAAE